LHLWLCGIFDVQETSYIQQFYNKINKYYTLWQIQGTCRPFLKIHHIQTPHMMSLQPGDKDVLILNVDDTLWQIQEMNVIVDWFVSMVEVFNLVFLAEWGFGIS